MGRVLPGLAQPSGGSTLITRWPLPRVRAPARSAHAARSTRGTRPATGPPGRGKGRGRGAPQAGPARTPRPRGDDTWAGAARHCHPLPGPRSSSAPAGLQPGSRLGIEMTVTRPVQKAKTLKSHAERRVVVEMLNETFFKKKFVKVFIWKCFRSILREHIKLLKIFYEIFIFSIVFLFIVSILCFYLLKIFYKIFILCRNITPLRESDPTKSDFDAVRMFTMGPVSRLQRK